MLTGLLALFIAFTGGWKKAMVTVYLCGLSVAFARDDRAFPSAFWSARNERVHRRGSRCASTRCRRLPSFVYLIPVVMLFRVGDFAAMLAIVAYAVAPAIRYNRPRYPPESRPTWWKPPGRSDAPVGRFCARCSCRWRCRRSCWGINQTIMMALSMLVITALVGTRELGQEVYIALTKADTGRGLVAGVSVAAIAIISDRLIKAWVARRRAALGLGDT